MATTFIPFDGWSPGSSYYGEGWGTCNNLAPFFDGWKPWNSFVATFSPAVLPITGNHVHIWASAAGGYSPDAQTIFGGSGSLALAAPERLYVIDPAALTFTDVSRGGNYSPFTAGWRFASVGNDIWATNGVDALQRRTNNAGNFADGAVSTFKPIPRFLAAVREHLVGANLANGGHFQDEIVWSDADDPTNWDPATGGSTSISLASSKRLVSVPGQITGIVGGQYLLIFKRTGIFYGEYSGYPNIFNFDVLSPHIGTAFPASIINSRYGIFFLGTDGFYSINGLAEPQKLSTSGIDHEILGSAFSNYPTSFGAAWQEDVHAIGFQLFEQPLVGWLLSKDQTSVGNDFAVLYNPVTQQWARLSFSTLITSIVQRPTADTLLNATAALTYNGSAVGYCPQSAAAFSAPTIGLNFRPANIDASKRLGQTRMNWVLPIFSKTAVTGGGLSLTITVEPMLDPSAGVYGSPYVVTSANRNVIDGSYPVQLAARFFRITITGSTEDFVNFEGLWVDTDGLSPAGA